MRIGIACTLKPDGPPPADGPDDLNEEFDSPATVKAVGDVFRSLGHTVVELGDGRPFIEAVLKNPPDLVFNFARTVTVLVNGALFAEGDVATISTDPRVKAVYLGEGHG